MILRHFLGRQVVRAGGGQTGSGSHPVAGSGVRTFRFYYHSLVQFNKQQISNITSSQIFRKPHNF
jgi:hypothetical protein